MSKKTDVTNVLIDKVGLSDEEIASRKKYVFNEDDYDEDNEVMFSISARVVEGNQMITSVSIKGNLGLVVNAFVSSHDDGGPLRELIEYVNQELFIKDVEKKTGKSFNELREEFLKEEELNGKELSVEQMATMFGKPTTEA